MPESEYTAFPALNSRPVENWQDGAQRAMTLDEAKDLLHDDQLLDDDDNPMDAYLVTTQYVDALLTLIENGYRIDRNLVYLRLVGPRV